MDTEKLSCKTFRRKMLLWASEWSQEDDQKEEVHNALDAMDVARILQATGYRLRTTDKSCSGETSPMPGESKGKSSCEVIITCPHSGLRMHMDAPVGEGRCQEASECSSSGQVKEGAQSLVPELDPKISIAVGEIIRKVLSLIGPLRDPNHNVNATHSNIDSPVKTPYSGITIITPNAPDIPRKNQGNIPVPNRYRSLDTLTSSGEGYHDLPEPGQLTPKHEFMAEDSNEETAAHADSHSGKKFISRSSPAMSTNSLLRSNTFTYEDDVQDNQGPSPVPASPSRFLQQLCDTQLMLSEVIFALEGNKTLLKCISKASDHSVALNSTHQKPAEDIRPIHRLSTFGVLPALKRAVTSVRTNVQPQVRRSTTSLAVPVTPTSSRGTAAASSTKPRKSASTTTLQTAGLTSKSSRASLASGSSMSSRHSIGPGGRVQQSDSPGARSAAFTRRSMGNPKYSQVQSSIPKLTHSRKRQE